MKTINWILLLTALTVSGCFDRQNSQAPARSLGLASGPGYKCLKRDAFDDSTLKLYIAQDTDNVTLHEYSDSGVTQPHYITIMNQSYNVFPLGLVANPDILSVKRLIKQESRGGRDITYYLRVYVDELAQNGFIDLYKMSTRADGSVEQNRETLLASLSGCEKV